jgi:S-adenosylmethionine decarboxylase
MFAMTSGREWLVEAYGCGAAALRDVSTLEALFESLVRDLSLKPVAPPQWHRFPAPGGVTGFVMLAESHLACHTFPEHGTLCLNLFCCKPRPEYNFEERLRQTVGAERVEVRSLERPFLIPVGTVRSA